MPQPLAPVLEIVPLFFNVDFVNIATLLGRFAVGQASGMLKQTGLHYSVVVGGKVHDTRPKHLEIPHQVYEGIEAMASCQGNWSCVKVALGGVFILQASTAGAVVHQWAHACWRVP